MSSKLTKEAREYCKQYFMDQGRESLVESLEAICVACYEDEDIDDLLESAVDSVEAGDIEFCWKFTTAKASSHRAYMLWLDIDEVWR